MDSEQSISKDPVVEKIVSDRVEAFWKSIGSERTTKGQVSSNDQRSPPFSLSLSRPSNLNPPRGLETQAHSPHFTSLAHSVPLCSRKRYPRRPGSAKERSVPFDLELNSLSLSLLSLFPPLTFRSFPALRTTSPGRNGFSTSISVPVQQNEVRLVSIFLSLLPLSHQLTRSPLPFPLLLPTPLRSSPPSTRSPPLNQERNQISTLTTTHIQSLLLRLMDFVTSSKRAHIPLKAEILPGEDGSRPWRIEIGGETNVSVGGSHAPREGSGGSEAGDQLSEASGWTLG